MNKLNQKHFSLADWEFEPDHQYYISTVQYVSPPSSLATPAVDVARRMFYCYLSDELAHCVPDGRIITYIRFGYLVRSYDFYFRQQPPLAYQGNQNGYRLQLQPANDRWRIYRWQDGAGGIIYTGATPEFLAETWYRFKVDFYQYLTEDLELTFRIEFFLEQAGEWVSLGYYDDGTNLFADSDVNRVGFSLDGYNLLTIDYADDTEIWEKA